LDWVTGVVANRLNGQSSLKEANVARTRHFLSLFTWVVFKRQQAPSCAQQLETPMSRTREVHCVIAGLDITRILDPSFYRAILTYIVHKCIPLK
jgi:hypothetical protein